MATTKKAANFPEGTKVKYTNLRGKTLTATVQRAYDLESGETSLEAWSHETGNMLLLFVELYNVEITK